MWTLRRHVLTQKRLISLFAEGDIAIVRPLKNISQASLTKPLVKDYVAQTQNGEVHHNDIIGQPKRVFLQYHSKKDTNQKYQRYVVTEPTLEEYTSMIARRAQPIYSMDANVIVALANIDAPDIDPESLDSIKPHHYLEAGTGNGSLTLLICHAIHGSNAVARLKKDQSLRGAILHSVDRKADHLELGSSNVRKYKRGKFAGDVDFYRHDLPSTWIQEHQNIQLHGVFLDLPDPHLYLKDLSHKLEPDGTIIVFCPSVTQILQCREALADARLANDPIDLQLIKTVELPPGNGGGTREWDVSTVFTRETGEKVSVCRPKVGARVIGGGFVGVFKKLSVAGVSMREKWANEAADTEKIS